jgi:hypothetical protein
VKAVRLTRANGLNPRVQGEKNSVLILEDGEAAALVENSLAVYAPGYDPQPSFTAGGAQEIPVVKKENAPAPDEVPDIADAAFAGPEHAAKRMQELAGYTGELGLYENQQPVVDQDALEAGYPIDIDPSPGLKQPWTTAPKSEWIEWAVHGDHGKERPAPEEAAVMTKAQLMNSYSYGERL